MSKTTLRYHLFSTESLSIIVIFVDTCYQTALSLYQTVFATVTTDVETERL